jgi:hypothetical protein
MVSATVDDLPRRRMQVHDGTQAGSSRGNDTGKRAVAASGTALAASVRIFDRGYYAITITRPSPFARFRRLDRLADNNSCLLDQAGRLVGSN